MHQLEMSKLKIILKKLPIWLENNIKLLHVLTFLLVEKLEGKLCKQTFNVQKNNKLLFFDLLYFIPGKGYNKYIS